MMPDSDVIVIGAGVSGLCAAWQLTQRLGRDAVLTLEAAPVPGGTTGSDCADGFVFDWGSNGFLDKEPLTLAWADELGLTPHLVRANEAAAKRFIYRAGRLHQVKAPPSFFTSPLLSPRGRLRLCCEPLIPQKKDAAPESVFDFAARRIGREAAEMLVSAMVLGIYGGNARELSMEHCFPRMVALERRHGGLVKALLAIRKERGSANPMGPAGVLTTFQGGIGKLPERAAELLGDRVMFNTTVTEARRVPGGFSVRTAAGENYTARALVVAVPAYAAAAILREMDAPTARALDAIPYAGLAVLCAGYARERIGHNLDGFGFLVPPCQKPRLLGCIFTSSLFPFEASANHALLRVMLGGAPDPEAINLSDTELLDCVRQDLDPLLDIAGPPDFLRIYRHPRGIPQYTLGHEKRLEAVENAERAFPGLVFAGNAYHGISLNDCVISAHRATKKVLAFP